MNGPYQPPSKAFLGENLGLKQYRIVSLSFMCISTRQYIIIFLMRTFLKTEQKTIAWVYARMRKEQLFSIRSYHMQLYVL